MFHVIGAMAEFERGQWQDWKRCELEGVKVAGNHCQR